MFRKVGNLDQDRGCDPNRLLSKGQCPLRVVCRHPPSACALQGKLTFCRSASSRKLTSGAHHRLSFLVVLSRERRAESATALARSSQVRTACSTVSQRQ